MEILTALTESLKPDNEDGFGYRDEALWVVDAATPLAPGLDGAESAAVWLRQLTCTLLAYAPWQADSLNLTLAWLIERLAAGGREHGLATTSGFPTGAIALVRQRVAAVDVCLLGDVTVIVRNSAGAVVKLVDPQFDETETAVLASVAARLADGTHPSVIYPEAYALLQKRRLARNTKDGLWVLSNVTAAAEHAYLRTVPTSPGSDLLVMSDGFARLVDPFRIVPDTTTLIDEVAAGHAADLLKTLRTAEADDPECVRFPRFGTSDDATAVHAQL